jgi:hypothetical protein
MNRIFLKSASRYALSQTNRAALSPSALPRGPETGFGEIDGDLPQADLNEALRADAFACPVSAVCL